MPSHLDEEKLKEKPGKMIAEGIITDEDINHNFMADYIAKDALKYEALPSSVLARMRLRANMTIVVQSMMVRIWRQHARIEREGLQRAKKNVACSVEINSATTDYDDDHEAAMLAEMEQNLRQAFTESMDADD